MQPLWSHVQQIHDPAVQGCQEDSRSGHPSSPLLVQMGGGDEVVRHGMSYLSWNYDSPGETRVMFTGDAAEFPDDDRVKRYIDSYASRFIHAYSGPEGIEMVVDDVY